MINLLLTVVCCVVDIFIGPGESEPLIRPQSLSVCGSTCYVNCKDISKLLLLLFKECMCISSKLQRLPDERNPAINQRRLVISSAKQRKQKLLFYKCFQKLGPASLCFVTTMV